MNKPYIYIYSLPFVTPSHLGPHSALSRVPSMGDLIIFKVTCIMFNTMLLVFITIKCSNLVVILNNLDLMCFKKHFTVCNIRLKVYIIFGLRILFQWLCSNDIIKDLAQKLTLKQHILKHYKHILKLSSFYITVMNAIIYWWLPKQLSKMKWMNQEKYKIIYN